MPTDRTTTTEGATDINGNDRPATPAVHILPFRLTLRIVALFYALFLFVTAIPWWLGLGSPAIWMTAAIGGGVVARALRRFDELRDRMHQSQISELKAVAENWESRWRLLSTDSQQTTTALAQMADGVIVLSNAGIVLLINPSARRLLFLDDAAVYIGRMLSEIARHPMINDLIAQARQGDSDCNASIEVTDGKVVCPVRVSINRIALAGAGKLLIILHDETESQRVEHIRREFVANVSHELKTPLAAIKGYAETVELAIQDDPESASYFMKQILSQCVRLERLVADMMQLARAQDGMRNMTFVKLPLQEVIADAIRTCTPIAESKQIELKVGDVQDDAIVIADREATLTIVNNLISNALRYTPAGGNVDVGTERRDGFIALFVKDDGVGIHESEQKRIFERFYRVEKTRESAGGGTGIGLSIVKNLAIAQQGQVELSSRPGQGSTFRVMLPAAEISR